MSNITITGLVATTPRYLLSVDNSPSISFRVASDELTNGVINWYTITAFGQLANNARDSIEKGNRIIVSGELNIRDWDNGERTGTSVELEASSVGHDLNHGTTKFTRTYLVQKHSCDCNKCEKRNK
jgi:single-strand DNA-binding protein